MEGELPATREGDFTLAMDKPYELACGERLKPVTLRYTIYGELNPRRDNALLVCHALSGSSRVGDWWRAMCGPGRPFDTDRWCIIGSNVLGSCYGSTGPTSVHPQTGKPYACDFPLVAIRDMVRAQSQLLDHLGISTVHCVIGGSIGGMQALQWAVDFPDRLRGSIAIGATPLDAMGLALSHLQRQAIQNDPAWRGGRYDASDPPRVGLMLAREIAMCTYKSAQLFTERYARRPNRNGEDPYRFKQDRFDVAGYLDYQGAIFTKRFDANTYVALSKAMDNFDLAQGYESEMAALHRIRAPILMVGISSDWLFPPADVRALTERMCNAGVKAHYRELMSAHGHDGFLADTGQLSSLITPFLKSFFEEVS
jgi:homoserine O-acetyltransferase